MSHSNQFPEDGGASSTTRRYIPRATRACEMCRLKKAKCNQQNPCSYCLKRSVECIYSSSRDGNVNEDKNRRARTRKEGRSFSLAAQVPSNTDQQGQQSDYWNESQTTATGSSPQLFSGVNTVEHGDHRTDNGEGLEEDPDPDIVGDINKHTSGTEFYGLSSNFVLLSQLFSRAGLHASDADSDISSSLRITQVSPVSASGYSAYVSSPDSIGQDAGTFNPKVSKVLSSHLSAGRLSIVNLLYNEEAALPPSRPKTPIVLSRSLQDASNNDMTLGSNAENVNRTEYITSVSNQYLGSGQGVSTTSSSNLKRHKSSSTRLNKEISTELHASDKLIEREYVRVFFNNLHHLHPFLLTEEFTSRCEREIWRCSYSVEPQQERKHFLALYNIVVAVGSLIARKDMLPFSDNEARDIVEKGSREGQAPSSMALSVTYFRKSRMLLGDVFEVCSLESAQTLFLMVSAQRYYIRLSSLSVGSDLSVPVKSLYCQNALKPHSCYMYSGMAVRTALAIGLPSESMSKSMVARKVARRTWWCIYSHEIDMCCSSGRRDSLRKPGSYLIPFPLIKDQDGDSIECEAHNMSMINEMVRFAIVLRKTSKEIYHDSKGLTVLEKSLRALELDAELMAWRRNLPPWLDLESTSFREPEWATKQKLVLQLRYLNARILIHRPFLACVASQNVAHLESNIEQCLDASRKTIALMYESYAHRYYFRTWWYNSTYTLYAGMILLYIILLNYDRVPGEELLRDVEKSHEILKSMEEASVARRSAALMLEVIEVAKTYLVQRRLSMQLSSMHSYPPEFGIGVTEGSDGHAIGNLSIDQSTYWQRTLFADDFLGLRRVDMLSTLINPSILGDFAAENSYSTQNDLFFDLGNHGPPGLWGPT